MCIESTIWVKHRFIRLFQHWKTKPTLKEQLVNSLFVWDTCFIYIYIYICFNLFVYVLFSDPEATPMSFKVLSQMTFKWATYLRWWCVYVRDTWMMFTSFSINTYSQDLFGTLIFVCPIWVSFVGKTSNLFLYKITLETIPGTNQYSAMKVNYLAQWNNGSLWLGSNSRLTDYESDALSH